MRIVLSLVLIVAGLGLCFLDTVPASFDRAHVRKFYERQLAAAPVQQTYTQAECTAAAWQAWTNRIHLPAKETYTPADLSDALFGVGIQQTACDRQTFEALIANASGFRKQDSGLRLTVPGVLTMMAGACLLGGVMFPHVESKRI